MLPHIADSQNGSHPNQPPLSGMEGDGGMVAVVEGLRDAGLAVTLLSRRLRTPHNRAAVTGHSSESCNKRILYEHTGANPSNQACQTAVDAATETTSKNGSNNTIYRSSYQMAHCRPSKFTPAYLDHYSVQRFQQYRVGSTSRSADEEAFVESLRKYPTSPVRSQSADLIERMLNYTQFKNGSRYSNKSTKSLPSKEALKKLHFDEIPTRDNNNTKTDSKPNFGYKRDVELIPVPTSSKKSRCDDQIGMFDYLKSHHKDKKLKGTDVRYLTTLKQCIKERLRQLCDEETTPTTICPKIQSRYNQHRKRYHKCTTCKQSMTQDASQNEIKISPSPSKERIESTVDKSLTTFKHSKACFCDSPEPCDWRSKTSPSKFKSKVPPEYIASEITKHKQCMSFCEHECYRNDDEYERNLKDNVFNWLQELPVYANFSARDAIRRQEIINQLIENLKKIDKNAPNLDKVEYEIKECLKVLPMWRPENKIDQESFENKLAQNLLERIKKLLCENNELEDHISMWITSIPFTCNTVDKQKIINELIATLKPITVNRPLSDKEYKETLKSQITKMLNDLPIVCNGSRNMVINSIADKLVDKLVSLPRQQLDLDQGNLPKEQLNDIVQKWFDDMPRTLGVDILDNKEDVEMLATKLQELQSIANNEYRQNSMREEITNWLQNLQKKRGRYVDSGTQENLVNKLVAMINGESIVEYNSMRSDLITQNIWDWLEAQPQFKDHNLQLKDMIMELSGKLHDIKDKKGDVSGYDLKTELTNWFEKLSREYDIEIDSDNRNKLQENLLTFFSPTKRRKYWEKPNSLRELATKKISDIINDSAVQLKESDKERLKDQIVQVLIQDWNSIKSIRSDELLSNITNILRQAKNLPEAQITGLAKTLSTKIKEDVLPNLAATIEGRPLELDKTSKNLLKSKLECILGTLTLNSKEKVIEAITDTLMGNNEDDKNGAFELIFEELKKANVSEIEAQNLASNVLDMWQQFKNEINDTTCKSPSYGSAESLWVHKQMFMQKLEREITGFMEKVLNEKSSFYKENTSEDSLNQYNKFKIPPFITSTPIKLDNGRNDIEKMYKNEIKEIIKKWIGTLEIYGILDETFKDDMAHDIATDIIDRQRYIQLSKTKPSSQEELEHLKYQVFKWTSKLPNQTNLTTKISKLKMLMRSIEAIKIPNLIQETSEQQFISNLEDTTENLEGNINDVIKNWLNEKLYLKHKDSQDRQIIDDLIIELSKKLKSLLSSNAQPSDVENLCKNEIVVFLRKLDCERQSDKEIQNVASELLHYLKKSLEFFADILEQNQETANKLRKKDAIIRAVQNWCQTLPLKRGTMYSDIKNIVDNLAEAVSRYLLITDVENVNTFMDEILSNLKKLPLQFDKDESKNLPEFTERLIETLKEVLNDSEKYWTNDSSVRKPALKKAADILYDNIQNWCENLPLNLDFANEGSGQINVIKQNLATKLMKKVGELNLDPEIFHDDDLYEDILKDEIDKILDTLPKDRQLQDMLPTLKENLVKDLLEAKEEMKNEIAGFAYKQKLRDAISKTLSSIGLSITETEQTPIELLKDNLADAFISLHYVANDEELKKKFKDKIFNEVNNFCDDYLKRNPSSPVNVHQLNQELYNALKNVPVPKEESMRREVEQIRIKDLVNDWFNELPLEDTFTLSHSQKNKIISILAKRLYEIENEAACNPDLDIDETMNNEISKWIKKLKLKSVDETGTETVAKTLINKLKATKHSRKLSESTMRKSINYADLSSDLDGIPRYPPSRLSAEDRAHLQQIRDRLSANGNILKSDDHKDASVSPVPIATGIQTEDKQSPDNYIFQKSSHNASIQTINQYPQPATQIIPQVIVKEYYWDSHGSPTMQRSGSILSYVQPPAARIDETIQQQAMGTPNGTSHVTSASQTVPLPASKATVTQEASIEQVIKTRIQNNDTLGTLTQDSCLATTKAIAKQHLSSELNKDSQTRHYSPDDYLQLSLGKKGAKKPCQPCWGRAVLSDEAGPSKDFKQARSSLQLEEGTDKETGYERNRSQSSPCAHINEKSNYWDDEDNLNQPCFRRPIYQSPTRDSECPLKRKRKSQQRCTCKSPTLTKCTLRPQASCQHSNKSCYVAKKHCPKCWDGFCPYPSFLYFRQD